MDESKPNSHLCDGRNTPTKGALNCLKLRFHSVRSQKYWRVPHRFPNQGKQIPFFSKLQRRVLRIVLLSLSTGPYPPNFLFSTKIQSIFLENVIRMDATNRKPLSTWAKKSLSFLVWMSPLFSLGPFFPLGVLFAFPREYKLQMKALVVIGIYVLTWILVFPLELLHRSSLSWETEINAFFSQENNLNLTKFGIVIFVFLCLVLNLFHSLKRKFKTRKGPSNKNWTQRTQI